jgi:hypothetical protein
LHILLFDIEHEVYMLLRNVGMSPNYTMFLPGKQPNKL